MKVIASLCFAFLFAAISPAAEPHSPTATGSTESLVTLPRYLVEAIRIAREVGGPDLKLILNEWGNETTQSPRGDAFFALIQALKGEGIPVDGAGLQLDCRLKDGQLHGWANNQPFDFDAFDAMLKLYEQAGIEVHITEFDIHLVAKPTPQDFELQGKYYAEVLRHALQSPAVKSFKTWGFTDRHSWKADGVDGHPLLLDENLQPKPAYLRQVEMLRALAPKATKPAGPSAQARQAALTPPKPWTLGERDGRQCLLTPEGKPFLMLGVSLNVPKEGRLAR